MQKNRAERPPNLARVCLSLLLIAAVALSGCGGKDTPAPTPTTAPTTVPTRAPTSAPTAAPTTLPATSGNTVAIITGGSIVVPEGALPKDAKVSTTATQMPALPDDVKPVGSAFSITSSAQPTQPVTLRLPIPAGVADPSNLAVIRVESDGAATFLMTETEGGELVAATPGFSTFAVVDLLDSKSVVLVGNAALIPGERTTFYPRFETEVNAQGGDWSISGDFTLVYDSATSAIVQAGSTPGYGALNYEFVDLARGRRWYGSRPLASYSGAGKFKAGLITRTPHAYAGEDVLFTASAYGEFEGPITWSWDFGNGTKGEKTTDAAVRNLELPLTRYEGPQEGREYRLYAVHLTARDAMNREARDDSSLYVTARQFQVVLEGPQILSWKDGGVSATYTAAASGGVSPYEFTWSLPAAKPSTVSRTDNPQQQFTFPEPGDYRLEIDVDDDAQGMTSAFLPIRVQGGEALSARFLDLPATAKPGAKITFSTQIRGGVLVVAGKKSGYTVLVDWRDGSQPTLEKNVGADRTPDQGTVHQMSHAWTEPKTYAVIVLAWDATGRMAGGSREITITDAGPTASPTTPKANTPPVADDITTSTKSGAAVAITLKGTDADGDSLTYTFTRPANGSVTGTTPFLTYTPKAGFSGTDTFTYKVRDGKADSPAATVRISVGGVRWVRDGAPLINATDPKQPLEYHGGVNDPLYFGEARFAGKFTIYRLSETLIAMDDREVDHGKEYWNVTYESRFDAPPAELTPGQVVTLTVKISAFGNVTEGMPSTVRFQFGADKAHASIIKPSQPVAYNRWNTQNPGADSGVWTLTVPNGKPGDRFQVWAGWWNCAVCNVTWTYKAE